MCKVRIIETKKVSDYTIRVLREDFQKILKENGFDFPNINSNVNYAHRFQDIFDENQVSKIESLIKEYPGDSVYKNFPEIVSRFTIQEKGLFQWRYVTDFPTLEKANNWINEKLEKENLNFLAKQFKPIIHREVEFYESLIGTFRY